MADRVLDVKETRDFLRDRLGLDLPEWRLYAHARTGAFPPGECTIREGKNLWFRQSGLERWIERGGNIAREAQAA